MATYSVIAAGFGGQGVMLMGKIIAEAAMHDGKKVTWLPSYGPEMRGGTANCTVVISDEDIGSPVVDIPDVVIAMNIPSMFKFEKELKKDGILLLNSSVIDRDPTRKDVKVFKIDANKIADEIGNVKVLNMVTLGAFAKASGIITFDSIKKALEETMTGKKKVFLDINIKAVQEGMNKVEEA
ncbi:2-oxoacid:acceptor oxidoreductase family protein [Mesoaciditoga lauensis]|uniref:2-oxoacid:acceptor oxidoreductase family protein n=1 Tax=Mesoaciditoga lauensis TaxID=1495039 RepID=UPI00055C227C|nr:2-oxoacid:acceptor oxidoreductase family protein [Mesoaciditoga lauensis]